MTAQLPEWLTDQAPAKPTYLTRADLIEVGALAVAMTDAWTDGDLKPIAPEFDDTSHRDVMIDLATEVLDAAYPQVSTADEIEALPMGTVIVNEAGSVLQRFAAAASVTSDGVQVGRSRCWIEPGSTFSPRNSRTGHTSASLAGTWTVVHRPVAS